MPTPARRAALAALAAALLAAPSAAPSPPAPWDALVAAQSYGGDRDARVWIVMVGDFQCPFCFRALETMKALEGRHGKALRFTFVHNPLAMHARAEPAARAAVAAARQGRFQAMHDRLFTHRDDLSDEALRELARDAGLKLPRFARDLADPAVADFVARQARLARAVDARGTPTFFVNGQRIRGAQPEPVFEEAVREELAVAARAGRSGRAWLAERLAAVDPELHRYLVLGEEPPAEAPPRPADRADPAGPEEDATLWAVPVLPDDGRLGPDGALVRVVVFTDYQCPYCARLEGTLARLREAWPEDVQVVVRHNPLPFHARALPAAVAAICAGRQGRFAAMHDAIFRNARALEEADLDARAEEVGLDAAAFRACLADPSAALRVERDRADAERVGARGTPTSFINGRQVRGAQPYEVFAAVVEQELPRARAEREAGGRQGLYERLVAAGRAASTLDEAVHAFALPEAPRAGGEGADLDLVVFLDPFSAADLPEALAALRGRFGDRLAFTWGLLPREGDPLSRLAAKALVCAQARGVRDEVAAALAGTARTLDRAAVADAFRLAGADPEGLEACLDAPETWERVEGEAAEARQAGAKSPPAAFVNGRRVLAPGDLTARRLAWILDTAVLVDASGRTRAR